MTRCLIIGASGGIGAALAQVETGEVIGLSRADDGLDVTDEASVDTAFARLEGVFDRIWVAFGILSAGQGPEKSLSALSAEEMQRVFAVNTIGVGLVLSRLPKVLAKTGKVGVLTARVGSIGDNRLGGWHSYRASKAAANQLIRGASIELARTHKGSTVVAMHPGTVATPFTENYNAPNKLSPVDAAERLKSVLDGLSADQTGQFFDYKGEVIPW